MPMFSDKTFVDKYRKKNYWQFFHQSKLAETTRKKTYYIFNIYFKQIQGQNLFKHSWHISYNHKF